MRLFRRRLRIHEIAPDEIFLDSSNLPGYNATQFEGRVAQPVGVRSIIAVAIVFIIITAVFTYRAYSLEVRDGAMYADISENNTLDRHILFATRGLVYDRTGRELAWNEAQVATSSGAVIDDGNLFALRKYTSRPGLSHVLGFLRYPKADAKGTWWREEYSGVAGVELSFDERLRGTNGSTMVERDATGLLLRENIVAPPVRGQDLTLALDADIQSKLHELLAAHANRQGFRGGAAVIMDVHTGEVIALTSFPEYDSQAYTDGDSAHVAKTSQDARTPLLNRAVAGLYTPGSIVKPIFAIAALNERLISPDKQIESVGALVLPNPFDASKPSIFRDWTVHGWVDMRTAIAVSSDEYFYVIGGGFQGQKGLGIAKIDEYSKLFGLDTPTGIDLTGEVSGIIPTPAWKEQVFGENDPWRIGNTYHTSIGQFGFQITPLEAARFTAAIANGGKLVKPQLLASSTPEYTEIGIPDEYLQVAREGMRLAVTSSRSDATVKSLYIGGIEIAAKTGTAQLGSRNQYMNQRRSMPTPSCSSMRPRARSRERRQVCCHSSSGSLPRNPITCGDLFNSFVCPCSINGAG
jgi:penicillin-binding protein 2